MLPLIWSKCSGTGLPHSDSVVPILMPRLADDPGVVAACIAGYDGEVFRKNIDNFAFALVAPLRTYDDRGLTLLQSKLRGTRWRPPDRIPESHTLYAHDDFFTMNCRER